MRMVRSLRRLLRIQRRTYEEILAHILRCNFWLLNRYGRKPLTQPVGPVVSLTTYGKRTQTVCLTIESIARGSLLPSRIILWIDEKAVIENLPAGIQRLVLRGLEVRSCNNYGPHKKYYPYLESLQRIDVALVTADDDVFYPRYWLKDLNEAFQKFPYVVNCYRARVIALEAGGLAKYEDWKLARSSEPSFCHCAVGVGGTIYPPPLQWLIKQEGDAFLECCPKGDDLWLHVQTLRAGYKIRQVSDQRFRLLHIPGTQSSALYHKNIVRGGNDWQVRLTYRASDIILLRKSE